MSDTLNHLEYSEKKTALESMPQMAWIAFTGKCNLKCEHCPVVRQAENNEDMDDAVYTRVVDELLPHLDEVVLGANNYGEQTLSKKIDGFLDTAHEKGIKVKLWTNGTLLSDALLETIVRTGTDLAISMEGAGDNYKKIRHFPYPKLENAIDRFIRLRETHQATNSIEIAYTLFKSNRDDLFELIKTGVDRIGISYLNAFDPRWENEVLTMGDIEGLKAGVFPKLIDEAAEHGVEIIYNDTRTDQDIETASLNCRDPWFRVNIRENGDVLPCCIAGDDLIMGNLKTKTFEEIWNGKRYQKLRHSFATQKLMGTCRVCKGISTHQKKTLFKRVESMVKQVLVSLKLYGVLNRLIEIKRSYYRR